jgi:autonomous glycyl radical cofactor GrcA
MLFISSVARAQSKFDKQVPNEAPKIGAPELLDEAVASVDGKVITGTQLEFEARILLMKSGASRAAFDPLDSEILRSSLTALIDQRLSLIEADRLGSIEIEESELNRAIASLREKFESEDRFRAFLALHEAELQDVAVALRRGLRAQRVLEGKLKLKAQVSESEAKKYKAEHADLSEVPLETVRQRLYAVRFSALAKEELAAARKASDVRLIGRFAK